MDEIREAMDTNYLRCSSPWSAEIAKGERRILYLVGRGTYSTKALIPYWDLGARPMKP